MEKNIPTIEVTIGDKTVILYQWLTQEEENKLNAVLVGDIEIDSNQVKKSEIKVKVSMDKIGQSNKILIQSMCKSHTWEQVNEWRPSERSSLIDKINEVREKN